MSATSRLPRGAVRSGLVDVTPGSQASRACEHRRGCISVPSLPHPRERQPSSPFLLCLPECDGDGAVCHGLCLSYPGPALRPSSAAFWRSELQIPQPAPSVDTLPLLYRSPQRDRDTPINSHETKLRPWMKLFRKPTRGMAAGDHPQQGLRTVTRAHRPGPSTWLLQGPHCSVRWPPPRGSPGLDKEQKQNAFYQPACVRRSHATEPDLPCSGAGGLSLRVHGLKIPATALRSPSWDRVLPHTRHRSLRLWE